MLITLCISCVHYVYIYIMIKKETIYLAKYFFNTLNKEVLAKKENLKKKSISDIKILKFKFEANNFKYN